MLYVFGGLSFIGVGAVNFLWPLWDVKRQSWHDKVAGTIVVRADALELDRGRWSRRIRRWCVSSPCCPLRAEKPMLQATTLFETAYF